MKRVSRNGVTFAWGLLVMPLASCVEVSGPISGPVDADLEPVASGFVSPIGMDAPDDGTGRLFIADQVGRIHIIQADGTLEPELFLDLTDRIVALNPAFDERGLIGLALHPNFAVNGRFFVRYSRPRKGNPDESCNDGGGFIVGCHSEVLAEFRVSDSDPDRADPDSERMLITVDKPQFNHNGGQIAFGPDGFLYAGFGDGGGANDNGPGHTPGLGNAQDKSTLLGKIIRIDVDQGDPYAVPPNNPYVNVATARPEIWALGLRNPWRFSFDSGTGTRLFVADVGQDLFEEINIVVRGGNYGWNLREGDRCFDPNQPANPPTECAENDAEGRVLRGPILDYNHFNADGSAFGVAVIGGFVYRGSALPALRGKYLYGDYSAGLDRGNGIILAATEGDADRWSHSPIALASAGDGRLGRFLLAFGQDHEGELYVLTTDVVGPSGTTGQVFKLIPAP